jgi:hypothetical protein
MISGKPYLKKNSMPKKKITIEVNDSQYKDLVKVLALGEFALQGHLLETDKQIDKIMSFIYFYAKEFNCGDMVKGPFLFDNDYEINPDYMSNLIDDCFDAGMVKGEGLFRFMLKPSE